MSSMLTRELCAQIGVLDSLIEEDGSTVESMLDSIPEPQGEATIWLGVMVPAGTPPAVVDLLNTEINKILARPDIAEAWRAQGANPMIMKPVEFGAHVQSEIERWARLIKANGIKPIE